MSTTRTIMIVILVILLIGTTMALDFTTYQVSKPRGYKAIHMPQQNTCNSSPAIEDRDISLYKYNIMVLDGIDEQAIISALRYTPNIFSFNLVSNDPSQYTWNELGYPVPSIPRLIVVFNGTAHGYNLTPTGYYFGDGRSYIVYSGQDPYLLSWVFTHECLHESLKGSIDQDQQPTFVDQWNAWMQKREMGFWSGSDPQISAGWVRLQQDFLVSQCLTL